MRMIRSAPLPSDQYASPSIVRARHASSALAHVEAVGPFEVAARCIQRDGGPGGSRGEVQPVADHERRDFPVVFRGLSKIGGSPPPDDLQIFHVGCIDLIKRRIFRAACIAAVAARLKNWMARSCFSAAARVLNVPRPAGLR